MSNVILKDGDILKSNRPTHPSVLINNEMQARKITRKQLIIQLRTSIEDFDKLMKAQMDVTEDIAAGLEKVFGIPEKNWLELQKQYNQSVKKYHQIMNHEEIFEELAAKKHVSIVQLTYIALTDTETLFDYLDEWSKENWKEAFPDIYASEKFEEYYQNIEHCGVLHAMDDFKKYGLLAEIKISFCDNFKFNSEGEPVSWEYHDGMARIAYVYGNTLEELIENIRAKEAEIFQYNLNQFKEKSFQKS